MSRSHHQKSQQIKQRKYILLSVVLLLVLFGFAAISTMYANFSDNKVSYSKFQQQLIYIHSNGLSSPAY